MRAVKPQGEKEKSGESSGMQGEDRPADGGLRQMQRLGGGGGPAEDQERQYSGNAGAHGKRSPVKDEAGNSSAAAQGCIVQPERDGENFGEDQQRESAQA